MVPTMRRSHQGFGRATSSGGPERAVSRIVRGAGSLVRVGIRPMVRLSPTARKWHN